MPNMLDRRTALMGLLGGIPALALATPSLAQGRGAGDFASGFLADLMQVAGGGSVGAVNEYLRGRVDTQYAFDVAFAGIGANEGEKRRLAELMMQFLSREAVMLAAMAKGGSMRLNGSRVVEQGTMVNVSYRDSSGPYPLFVLVGEGEQFGTHLVRDFGSSEESSVVTKLAYATRSLQQVTPDAGVWIGSFERSLAGG